MLTRGSGARVGDVARVLARAPVRRPKPAPVLLRGYLESAERCAAANDCPYCRRELERVARVGSAPSCPHCGAAPFRRFCQDVGPCATHGDPR